MKIHKRNEFIPSKPHTQLSTGEVIPMLMDLKGWTQIELAKYSGITPRISVSLKMFGCRLE